MRRCNRKTGVLLIAISFSIPCFTVPVKAFVDSSNEYFDLDIAQLMQITITSVSKKPQNLSNAAAAAFVITQDDIHRSGVTSVPEALRMVPGLQVARVDANKWAITSRGFSGNFANKLLVMIDGRTVYSPAFSGVYWDVQDTLLDDIDRIEVVRGPGATIWGANAVNGVINIITSKASETQGGLINLGGGNEEQFFSGIRYGTAIGENIHGRVFLTYHDKDSFNLHKTGGDASDDWDSLRTGFRIDGEQTGNCSWTLQGDLYSNNENQIFSPIWLPEPPFRSVEYDDFEALGWNVLGRWQQELSQTGSWTIQTYYDYTNRDEAIMEQTHRIFDFDLQYQNHFGIRNHLVTGVGFRSVDTQFGNTFQVSVLPGKQSEILYSGFLQDELMLIPNRLWLTLGAKWEHNEFTGHEIQPSGRLLFKATDNQTVWAAVSRAVRTPSQFEESGQLTLAVIPVGEQDIMTVSLNGSEAFDSEVLIAYEAGYRWLVSSSLSLDVAVFYNDYDKLLTSDPVSPRRVNEVVLSNKMSGSTHGLELASDWRPVNWLTFQLGYTYIGFDLKADPGSLSANLGKITEGNSPKHQFSLRSTINVNQDLQLNLWGRYVDTLNTSKNILSLGDTIVDEYLELDVTVSWHPTDNLELMLVGQNLLDSSHLEYISEFSTPSTEIERSVYGKLTYHF